MSSLSATLAAVEMANAAVAEAVEYSDRRMSSNSSIRSADTITSLNSTTSSAATTTGVSDVVSKSIPLTSLISKPGAIPRRKDVNIQGIPTTILDKREKEKEIESENNSIIYSTNNSIVGVHVGDSSRSRLNSETSICSSVGEGITANTNDFASANSFIRSSRMNDGDSIVSRSSSIGSKGSFRSKKSGSRLGWSKEMVKSSIHSFVLGTQWVCGLFNNDTDTSFREEIFEARHGLPDDFRQKIDMDALFNAIALGYDGETDDNLDRIARILLKSAFRADSKGYLHLDKVAGKLLNFVEAREVKDEDARAASRLGRIGAGYALNNMITDHTNDISNRVNNIELLKIRLQETQNLLDSNQKLLQGKGENIDIVKGLLDKELSNNQGGARLMTLLGQLDITDESKDAKSESKTMLSKKEEKARAAAILYEQARIMDTSNRAQRAARERVGKTRMQLNFLNEMENNLDTGFKIHTSDDDDIDAVKARSINVDSTFIGESKLPPSQPKLRASREKPLPKKANTGVLMLSPVSQNETTMTQQTRSLEETSSSNQTKVLQNVLEESSDTGMVNTASPSRAIPPRRKRRPSIRAGTQMHSHSNSLAHGSRKPITITENEQEQEDWSNLEESGVKLNVSARLPDGSPLPSRSSAPSSSSSSTEDSNQHESQERANYWRKRLNSLALGECHSAYLVPETGSGSGAHISTVIIANSHSPLPSSSSTTHHTPGSESTDYNPFNRTGGTISTTATSTSASSIFPSSDRFPWNSQVKFNSSPNSSNILFGSSINTTISNYNSPIGASSKSDDTPQKEPSSQSNSISRCERYHTPFLEAKICSKAHVDLWTARTTISALKAVLWAVFQHFGEEAGDDVVSPKSSLLAKSIRMKTVKKILKEARLTTVSPGGSSPSFILRTASRLSTTSIDLEAKKLFNLTSASGYLSFSQFEKLIEQLAPMTLPADVAVPATRQQTRTRFVQGGGKAVYVQRSHAHLVGSPINKGGLDYTYGHKFGGSQNSRTRVSKNLMSKNKNHLSTLQSALNNVEMKLREHLKASKVDCVYQMMFTDALEGTGLSLGDHDILNFSAENNNNNNNNDNDGSTQMRETLCLWTKCQASLEVLFKHFATPESYRLTSITPPTDWSMLSLTQSEVKKQKKHKSGDYDNDNDDNDTDDSDSVVAYEVVAKEIVLEVIKDAVTKTDQEGKEGEEREKEKENEIESKDELSSTPTLQDPLLSLRGLRALLIECGLYDEFLLGSNALVGLVGTGNGVIDDNMLQDHFRQVKVWEWTIAHAVTASVQTTIEEGEEVAVIDEVALDATVKEMCGLSLVCWKDLKLGAGNLGLSLSGFVHFLERLALDMHADMPPIKAVNAFIKKLQL